MQYGEWRSSLCAPSPDSSQLDYKTAHILQAPQVILGRSFKPLGQIQVAHGALKTSALLAPHLAVVGPK